MTENILELFTANTDIDPSKEYVDEEGLICCSLCGGRKQKRLKNTLIDRDMIVTIPCPCEEERRNKEDAERKLREHNDQVSRLRDVCFRNSAMYECTFENAKVTEPDAFEKAKYYVEHWSDMKKENLGLLFWGDVGNGKTYLAACIANALMEDEVRVLMRNMSHFMNGTFEDRNEMLRDIVRYDLLIIDDFGMERGTEFGLEIVFDVIDARYASRKPTIITTNLSMNTLSHPKDQAHKRIYDRVLEMCTPVQFKGASIRDEIKKHKFDVFRSNYREEAYE